MANENLNVFLSNAKAYFLTTDNGINENLFDKLSDVFTKLLDKRPPNNFGAFNDLYKSACELPEATSNNGNNIMFITKEQSFINLNKKLFQVINRSITDKNQNETDLEIEIPNILKIGFNLEQIGVGLNKREYFMLFISIKALLEDNFSISLVRFWGKIFGTEKNYYVLECETKIGEENDEKENEFDENEDTDDDNKEESEVLLNVDIIPKPKFEKTLKIPKEERGVGTNKKSYYVCNEIGQPWVKLPDVQPSHIVMARKIKKFFTGDLNIALNCAPPFPGTEKNYLRAQIARISASTQISPLGFFVIDEEEEEDALNKQTIASNPDYEILSVKELSDSTGYMANWVHHVQYILPQGRTAWWSLPVKDEGEENDETDLQSNLIEPEIGPPLLTPLSEDTHFHGISPWISRQSSAFVLQHVLASVHSCLWTGAHCYASSKSFENIYIGWGLKNNGTDQKPFLPDAFTQEYDDSASIPEVDDPTAEQDSLNVIEDQGSLSMNNKNEDNYKNEDDEEDADEDD